MHEHLKASTENIVRTSEAHQQPSLFFRTTGCAKIANSGQQVFGEGNTLLQGSLSKHQF